MIELSQRDRERMKHIDHTLLKPTATWDEIKQLCEEGIYYHTASVCIPPVYVKRVRELFKNQLCICTVIGFPLGYSTTMTKIAETKQALEDGADEIDMVINLSELKNGNYDAVEKEIKELKKTVQEKTLKVIIETCYLTEQEKIVMCNIVTKAGADYIKTSTGFGTGGAKLEDILLFRKHIGFNVKIKAAGGVGSIEDLDAFLAAGCERIGTSSAIRILSNTSSIS